MGVLVWLAGPSIEIVVAALPLLASVAFLLYRQRTAIISLTLAFMAYAVVVTLAEGYPRPVARLVLIGGFMLAAADLFSRFANEMKVVADRERDAHAEVEAVRQELADTNRQLATRVEEQVEEVERLGRLRRFVTPQIAETLMSRDAEAMLATHRKQIAVLMCDLRGFTRFSATAEPEEVGEVLLDIRAYEAVRDRVDAEPVTLELKGFDGEVTAFRGIARLGGRVAVDRLRWARRPPHSLVLRRVGCQLGN